MNQPFTLTYSFDDTKGYAGCTPPDAGCVSERWGNVVSNPGTAVLEIAGVSYTFGMIGIDSDDVNVVMSYAQLDDFSFGQIASYFVQDGLGGTGIDSVYGYILPSPDTLSLTSWSDAYSSSQLVHNPFTFYINLTNGSNATGSLLPTSVVSSGLQSGTGGGAGTAGLQFVPVTPCRVADTRGATGDFGGPEIGAGATRSFSIPQSPCNIPSTAVAYSLNVTAVPDAALNYLTMWPAGEAQPNVSTLNSDGRIKANAAIVPAGVYGGVSVFVSDASNVILDIDGYFAPAGTASALAFYPVTPCRVADTRGATASLGGPFLAGGSSRSFPMQSSVCGLPTNAAAYSLNVTAIPHAKLNYLTSWPTGQSQPNVSTLNSPTGAVAANAAIIPAGSGGAVSLYVSDDADVILDVNGYFAAPATGGLSLYPTAPCRALDTRSASGLLNGVLAVDVEGGTCAPPATAQAYVLNATVVPSGPLSYVTLWPDGEVQPNVSTLNADDGAITSNLAILPTSDGVVRAFSSGSTQLLLDLSSYFAP